MDRKRFPNYKELIQRHRGGLEKARPLSGDEAAAAAAEFEHLKGEFGWHS